VAQLEAPRRHVFSPLTLASFAVLLRATWLVHSRSRPSTGHVAATPTAGFILKWNQRRELKARAVIAGTVAPKVSQERFCELDTVLGLAMSNTPL